MFTPLESAERTMPGKQSAGLMMIGFVGVILCLLAFAGCGTDNAASLSNAGNDANGHTSVMTIAIKENHDASGKDVYSFDPASITVNKGDTITIENHSDELQDIDQGDAQKAGVDVAIPINQSATMTFNTSGVFTISSEKGATITVTVH